MRPPHFRVRTLMIGVVVVAFLLCGAMLVSRSYMSYRLASAYGRDERLWREMAARDRANPGRARTVAAVWGPDIADFLGPLAKKHRQAMWRPWAPLEPDPPSPKFGSESK